MIVQTFELHPRNTFHLTPLALVGRKLSVRTKTHHAAVVIAILVLTTQPALAQTAETRPEWDQQKAVALVRQAIAVEENEGQPWDRIAWLTDANAAIARAQQENKPIFLYFYVTKGGPAAAPC